MVLYFLRHAKACARSRKWRPDSMRPLTRDGEEKMYEAARGMQTLDASFNLILTSPYARAFRTAEILAEVSGTKNLLETRNLIAEAEPEGIIAEITEKFPGAKELVLVGHEPCMSGLISVLLSGTDAMAIELRKGGCCKLSVKHLFFGPCATLEWLMTPGQLARLRRRK